MKQRDGSENRRFIADAVKLEDLRRDEFNLIASGCGTGKSFFVTNHLLSKMRGVSPEEVMFVTSRSLTVEQQARNESLAKFTMEDTNIINFWNNDDRINDAVLDRRMRIMTYDKIINILLHGNTTSGETLESVKIVVFDECHTLFSDVFIPGMYALQVWIRDVLYEAQKFIIGMTATPDILRDNSNRWGVVVNQLNKDILVAHQASQMICTDFDTIPYLIATNRLPGKTLILCVSVKDCFKLQEQIPNSAVLVSPNNKAYSRSMAEIRKHLVGYERFPDTFFVPDAAREEPSREDELPESGKDNEDASQPTQKKKVGRPKKTEPVKGTRHDLNVLITTTTAREGFNLSPESGVRNIVSCFGDDLHLTQICGRARYNLDNIVVAKTHVPYNSAKKQSYIAEREKLFADYMGNKNNAKWFYSVQHLVTHDIYGVKRFVLGTDVNRFIQYINSNWLVPAGVTGKDVKRYRIWKEEDKNSIIQACIRYKMLPVPDRLVTFNSAVSLLHGCLGYEVESGRLQNEKKRHTYKLVISYDEDSSTYIDAYPSEMPDDGEEVDAR